jgi:hypothetical protein
VLESTKLKCFAVGPLLQSRVATSLYQMGRSYLQRSSVKGSVVNDFGEEFNYTWNEIKKSVKRVVLNGVTLLLYNFASY